METPVQTRRRVQRELAKAVVDKAREMLAVSSLDPTEIRDVIHQRSKCLKALNVRLKDII